VFTWKVEIINTFLNQFSAYDRFILGKSGKQGVVTDDVDQSGCSLAHFMNKSNSLFGKNIKMPGTGMT
jgi:hypothetical protein